MRFTDRLQRVIETVPTMPQRLIAATCVGVVGALLIARQYAISPEFHTDFGMSWFGAQSILRGLDPYPLVGPGREFDYRWLLTYPAPSMIALLPFGYFTERVAAIAFVFLSTFLLAFGVLKKGWHLLILFLTEPFTNAARLGQWNIALTAALFLPWLAILAPVKPQAIVPVLASTTERGTWIAAITGSVVLLAASFLVLPGWLPEWLDAARAMPDSRPPVMRFGGVLILLVLLRWRRPESWLILSLACVPQTPAFYGLLPLLTIPSHFIESAFLAGAITLGGYIGATLLPSTIRSLDELHAYGGTVHVLAAFLPAVVLVLRRPNDTQSPAWIRGLLRYRRTGASAAEFVR